MIDISPPIVVVAYDRPRSLKRILTSLNNAYYPNSEIKLIISIDKSENNQEVLEIAKGYNWLHGAKEVRYQETNLGLKSHILKCGALSKVFESVIVLEDDLYVSPGFYSYALEALKFSLDKDYIAGVSLYNHKLNVHSRENFSPIDDDYDNWYFQFASSWGQVWSKEQWQGFENWFSTNNEIESKKTIPKNVLSWSNKSWLKHYIAYMVEKKKYFLYPKASLSTNFSDAGTHMGSDSTIYQVPLDFSKNKKYNFSKLEESSSVYDTFFENEILHKYLDKKKNEICIDLHAVREETDQRFWLTTKILDFKVCESFGRSLKPIDANIIESIDGEEIFFYDTSVRVKNQSKNDNIRKLIYNIKDISFSSSLRMSIHHILRKINIRK